VIGARHVPSALYDRARLAVRDALNLGGPVVFYGRSGTSKTYTAIRICEQLRIEPAYLELEPRPRGNDIEISVLRAFARGQDAGEELEQLDDRMGRRAARALLATHCERPRLVVLDEVHHGGIYGRDLIRFLIGRPANQAAFLLVGEKVEEYLANDTAFKSRVVRWVPFPELSRDEMVAFARAFHPIYEHSEPHLLERVLEFAGVHKRLWARIIEACLTVSDGIARELSDSLLDEAIRTVGL
jgi:hypothetical protein